MPGGQGDDPGRGPERGARGRDRHDAPAAVPAALPGHHLRRHRGGQAQLGGAAVEQVPDDVFVGEWHRESFHSMLSSVVKLAASPGQPRNCAMAREAVLLTVPVEMPSSLATSASLRSSK